MPDASSVSPLGMIAGALIPGVTGLIEGAANRKASIQNTERSFQLNKQLADYEYSKNLDMWNRANAYNDPSQQMARLKAAGLNPNLVYGSGAAAGNMASQLPKYQAPGVQYNAPSGMQLSGFNNAASLLSQYQDFRLKSAQLDNLKAQRDQITQETFNKSIMGRLLDAKVFGIGIANRKASELLDTDISRGIAENISRRAVAGYAPEKARIENDKLQAGVDALLQGISESQQRIVESQSRTGLNRQRWYQQGELFPLRKYFMAEQNSQMFTKGLNLISQNSLINAMVNQKNKQNDLLDKNIENYTINMWGNLVPKWLESAVSGYTRMSPFMNRWRWK